MYSYLPSACFDSNDNNDDNIHHQQHHNGNSNNSRDGVPNRDSKSSSSSNQQIKTYSRGRKEAKAAYIATECLPRQKPNEPRRASKNFSKSRPTEKKMLDGVVGFSFRLVCPFLLGGLAWCTWSGCLKCIACCYRNCNTTTATAAKSRCCYGYSTAAAATTATAVTSARTRVTACLP